MNDLHSLFNILLMFWWAIITDPKQFGYIKLQCWQGNTSALQFLT